MSKSHSNEILRIYRSKTTIDSWWCPEYGDIRIPEGWDFLPSGDAFVTIQVKQMGPHWIVLKKAKGYTATLGLWAPAENIKKAQELASQTEKERKHKRAISRRQREKQEAKYKEQFTKAVYEFLDFAPKHRALALDIAENTSVRATEVGSNHVGRTKRLSMEEKAELAARAYIRHRYTSYEEQIGVLDQEPDYELYRSAKIEAQFAVDEFLERYRMRRP